MNHRVIPGLFVLLLTVLLAACGGTTGSPPNQVNVTLSEFKIQSSQTNFTPGTTYHFVVTNNGHTNHEFMVMQPMSGAMSMGQMDSMALYRVDASQLPPGASKSFEYTFPASAAKQPLEFACHLPGHYEAGMHEAIYASS
jgi:uncharacterized cupredoxin-like copper-binding protein